MPLIQTSPPSVEPVSRADAKSFLRIDSDLTNDDTLVDLLISAARRYAESYCGRSFISQGWRLVLDSFPGPSLMGVPYGATYSIPAHAILIERGPLISIDSITYTAMDGSTQTMASSLYKADPTGPVPRITPHFGQIWPINLPEIGSVQVSYTAGYGAAASDVPEGIRHWILMRVKSMYDHRGEITAIEKVRVDANPWVDTLLDPYRVVW